MAINPNEVGAAWKKESANGGKFFSISLDLDKLVKANHGVIGGKVNLVMFARKNKQKETQPDYDLLLSTQTRSRPPAQPQPASPAGADPDDEIPW
jgi:hypothetical protein